MGKKQKAEGKKILDRSARVPLLVLITSALMLFINYVSEFNKKQTILKEAETQKQQKTPDRKEHTAFLKKACILLSSTRLFLMSETVTRFSFVSKDNHIVRTRTYDEEMLLTKKEIRYG